MGMKRIYLMYDELNEAYDDTTRTLNLNRVSDKEFNPVNHNKHWAGKYIPTRDF